MVEINENFLKTWRQNYSWPFHKSRKDSEEKIFELESLVKENILQKGSVSMKDALAKIVEWKTGGRFRAVNYFLNNDEDVIEDKINNLLDILNHDPDKLTEPIKCLTRLDGVKIAVASAFLRFLDPLKHKYGIIDKNVARFLNDENVTAFVLREGDDYIMYTMKNIQEYQTFHNWLQMKVTELGEATYTDIYGSEQKFAPVDVEMAIFAYTTQC